MDHSISGGCLCGQIRYNVLEKDLAGTYCHCTDCQKTTGSAFIFVFPMEPDKFILTNGTPNSHSRTADSGNKVTNNFCSSCGTTVFFGNIESPNYIWVQSGTLDKPEIVKAEQQIWTKRRLPWCNIDSGILSYKENPS